MCDLICDVTNCCVSSFKLLYR